MKLNPYLSFPGNCEEALTFYKACLGGKFESINRFKEGPPEMGGMKIPDHFGEKIMHMTWRFDDNIVMASDTLEDILEGGSVTLSIGMTNVDQMETVFNKLSEGGNVTMPLQDTFWEARFGMFTDKFSIKWMFNCNLK